MIITIAREVGSGGNEIAARLAKLLEAPLVDQEAVTRAAGLAGVTESTLADPEKVRAAVDTMTPLLLQYPRPSQIEQPNRGVTNVPPLDSAPFRRFIEALLQRIVASKQTVVILGYAAQVTLKDHRDALHVFVCAPPSIRVNYLNKLDEFSSDNAMRIIRQSDQVRADIFRKYFGVDWRNPDLYHLMINSENLTHHHAASLIVEASKRVSAAA